MLDHLYNLTYYMTISFTGIRDQVCQIFMLLMVIALK